MREAPQALREEAVRHLQALLRIDTTNPPGNEIEAARYCARVLEAEGIPAKVYEPFPGRGSVVAHALVRYVERYLEGLDSAPASDDAFANLATLRTVRDTARANGRAGTYLARAFGAPVAARYLEVLWNES